MDETTILLSLKLILQNQSKLAELFLLALQAAQVDKQQIHQALKTMLHQNAEVVKGLDSILSAQATQQFNPEGAQAQSIHDLFNEMLGGQQRR